jgi:hypothetical protein
MTVYLIAGKATVTAHYMTFLGQLSVLFGFGNDWQENLFAGKPAKP